MNWRIFVASTTHGLGYAQQISEMVNERLGYEACLVWDTQFEDASLDPLIVVLGRIPREFNAGIAVFTPDQPPSPTRVPLDNVMLELGMFIGSFGVDRSFLVRVDDAPLPGDLDGIVLRSVPGEENSTRCRDALSEVCQGIVQRLLDQPAPAYGVDDLVRLGTNRDARRPGEPVRMHELAGLLENHSGYRDCESVYSMWADAGAGSWIRVKAQHPVWTITFDNQPKSLPSNASIRPSGKAVATCLDGGFQELQFEARVPDGGPAVAIGVRVVDALMTHWAYTHHPDSQEYQLQDVAAGGGWQTFTIDLTNSATWSRFGQDGNCRYANPVPDFQSIFFVVFEVGSPDAHRPGVGHGTVEIQNLRLV